MTILGHMDREVPGVLRAYSNLSEVAHPSWLGVCGLFSRLDTEEHVAYFGRNPRGIANKDVIAGLLAAALGLFELAYNAMADLMPAYLGELSPLFDD